MHDDMHKHATPLPRTTALRRVLCDIRERSAVSDLLFLEAWEMRPSQHLGVTLRAHQVRRANPQLAAEIRAELSRGRPLTAVERAALAPE